MSEQGRGEDVLGNIRISAEQNELNYLLCPQCGDEFLHITKVSVHRGEDKITITSGNVSIDEQKNDSRGVIIEIEYLGECIHRGVITFHFYKGNVEVHHKPLKDRRVENGVFVNMLTGSEPDDIFRD
jgi:hypothetical protein